MKQNIIRFSFRIISTLFLINVAYAQSTIIKLPTINNTSSFNITRNDDANMLRMFADGGFYLGGTYTSGAIPVEGSGARLMWYPSKASFRVGYIDNAQWNDSNIGDQSLAMGSNTTASGNSSTALGYNTMASGTFSTALGTNTIASGSFSTALGYFTTASGNISTAMGFYATANGFRSTAIGNYVSTNSRQGSFILGDHSTTTTTNSLADHEMSMRFAGGYRFYTNSAVTIGVSIPANGNSWSSISDSTKKENYIEPDGEYFLNSLASLKLGSWNYKTQDEKQYRHYGPMAQEIFHYFGKDKFGTIGNDTTLASADMDGIIMICLRALERRTEELKNANERITLLEKTVHEQNSKLIAQDQNIDSFRNEFTEIKKIVSEFGRDKLLNEPKQKLGQNENTNNDSFSLNDNQYEE